MSSTILETNELNGACGPRRLELDHTYNETDRKTRAKGEARVADIRDSLLGNTIHAGVLAILLRDFILTNRVVTKLPTALELASAEPAQLGPESNKAERLARAYVGFQTHRGGEVRMESGPFRCLHRPSHQPISAKQWRWKDMLSCQWSLGGDHITSLAARALVLALRWKARSAAKVHSKFLHLTDSQTALGAFIKHRSNASALNYLLQRSASLELAGSLHPILCFVRSHDNPADRPSRIFLKLAPRKAPHVKMALRGGGH